MLKCLQKEPEKRYDSAAALAEDLRRFLGGESIVARPVPFWERGIKWALRRPAIATLAAAVLVLLAALLGLGIWSYERINTALHLAEVRRKAAEESQREAIKQSKAADANFARARKAVDDSFTIVSESKLLNVPGLRALRADLLGSSMRFYEEFLRERSDDPTLTNELLRTRLRVADVLRELGRTKEANEAYEAAIAGFEQALRDRPDELDLKTGLADSLYWPISTAWAGQKLATQRRIVALREDVFEGRHSDGQSKRDLARACSRLYESLKVRVPPKPPSFWNGAWCSGSSWPKRSRTTPTRSKACSCRSTSSRGQRVRVSRWPCTGGRSSSAESRCGCGRTIRLTPRPSCLATQATADQLSDLGRNDDAIAELRRSVKTLSELARANPDTPVIQDFYLGISRNLADRLAKLNRPDEAVRALLESRTALDRFPRETAADVADSAGRNVALAQRLGEIKPDLTPEQKVQRDELLDRAVSDYRAAVAGGWKELRRLEAGDANQRPPGLQRAVDGSRVRGEKPGQPDRVRQGSRCVRGLPT